MWTLKIQTYNKENLLNKLANKYNLTIYGYPLGSFTKNNKLYVNVAGKLDCSDRIKKSILKQLKKAKEIRNIELSNNFILFCIEQPKPIEKLYSQELIYIEPVKITNDFYQEYHIGSWNRNKLSELLNLKVKNVKIKILKFKEEKIKDISITSVSPELTDKQLGAFKFAFTNGYYNFPRDSELKSLSKLMKVSISTYQAHLRKAERKIMNFFYKYIK